MKILIAEDEAMMLAALQKNLADDGYEVIAAADGREAIEKFHSTNPDLVITDIMMPYTSGLELIGVVKSRPEPIPVIVLSAMGQETTVMEAFNLGADDFITKPFNPTELSLRVKHLLKNKTPRQAPVI
jgi:DNA-binding response OmpR family regulator